VENNEALLEEQLPDEETVSEEKTDVQTAEVADILAEDVEELKREFAELSELDDITELSNPTRYAALRDLGLTPREAFLATSAPVIKYDNRSHLSGAVPRRAGSASDMLGAGELMAARELFADLSDREIQKLYKKVSR
jgi:hypothetical protein